MMLKSWLIQNFKPILDSGELKLAPVTVLAGRNSSGKSSLIQSILMIAQTLSSRILDRALLPNGPIVQLGTFEDILSEQTSLRTIVVGFELETEEETKAPINSRTKQLDGKAVTRSSTNIKSVKVTSLFRSASSNGTSNSAIEASKVNVDNVSLEIMAYRYLPPDKSLFPDKSLLPEGGTPRPYKFSIDIKSLSSIEFYEFIKDILPEYLKLVPYNFKELNYLGTFKLTETSVNTHAPDPSLIVFSHFLPTRLISKYIIEERRRSRLIRNLNLALNYPHDFIEHLWESSEVLDLQAQVPDSLREAILNLYNDESVQKAFSGHTLLDLLDWHKSLKLDRKKKTVGNKLVEIIAQSILEAFPQVDNGKGNKALEALTNNTYVEYLEGSVEQVIRFFTSKIRYLGPLRADPQAAQRFSPSSELDDVGQKGEYAAAVYDANQHACIRWYNPFSEKVEQDTLKVALDNWARYLGVANEVQIQTAGQSGVSWQVVHLKGHKALPLTAVGVGVSQILPILVMGLLAPSNTLLLVEQPELHLHPSVQARLGDFFMGLAKCDKQCLIETHSENLVSQLRYHIVQAGGQENSDCLIYFVDQDQQGAARFNPIEISPQGNILNWPDGFFDETMLQEDRITAASLKKRAKKANNG
jgi:predicted ATPase